MDTKVKVGVLVISEDDKVLLIKEKIKKKPVPLWNIIKGTYDGGETIFDAARRECMEEANLDVDLVNALGAYISEDPKSIRAQFNFLANAKSIDASISSKSEQAILDECIEEVRWFTKSEIMQMQPEEFISDRTFQSLHDWIGGCKFPLDIYKHVTL